MKIIGHETEVKVQILGAGQDIGRSCIVIDYGISFIIYSKQTCNV